MTININEKISFFINEGFTYQQAVARVVQDIILHKIYNSNLRNFITIKGGLVLYNISSSSRRTTMDIDIDFIHYSISEEKIKLMINEFNNIEDGVKIYINGNIKDLKQEDYKGKRIVISLIDQFGNKIDNSKIDIGVNNKYFEIQNEYIFQLESLNENVLLTINSKEQIIIEKLCSLLKHGVRSTRYKDIYDLYYLMKSSLIETKYFYTQLITTKMFHKFQSIERIKNYLTDIFNNNFFKTNASLDEYNWVQCSYEDVTKYIINFIEKIYEYSNTKKIKV